MDNIEQLAKEFFWWSREDVVKKARAEGWTIPCGTWESAVESQRETCLLAARWHVLKVRQAKATSHNTRKPKRTRRASAVR